MFEINEETRNEAVEAMRNIFLSEGNDVSDKALHEAFDAAVRIVKQQFGM